MAHSVPEGIKGNCDEKSLRTVSHRTSLRTVGTLGSTSSRISHNGQAHLSVQNASFTVNVKKFGRTVGTKPILKGVSFAVHSGETMAVMGPSGAGKTTLMDMLTLERAGGVRTGNIDINNEPVTPSVLKKYCAYVPQRDSGWTFLTCRESLMYAADFFVVGSKAKRIEKVDSLITTMGLKNAQNTRVGNEYIRGLSGGEKRRLSLATAFLKNPLVVFLDEITSGLDAFAAASISSFMQQLARDKDVIIVCTIHQPSSKVFNGFSRLLLMSRGRVAFCGKTSHVENYFKGLGMTVTVHENLADFLLATVNSDFTDSTTVNMLLEAWERNPSKAAMDVRKFRWDLAYSRMQARSRPCSKTCTLLRRTVLNACRDPLTYISRLVMCLSCCCFFSFVYMKSWDRKQDQALSRYWLITWHYGVPSLMSLVACLGQWSEFGVVRREVKAGFYQFREYYIANMCVQVPYMVVLSLFCVGISGYAMGNWNTDKFCQVVLIHSLFLFSFECMAQLFAIMCPHPVLSMGMVMQMWFASFLFNGFIVPFKDTPWPFRSISYISPCRFCARTLGHLEYIGTTYEGAVLDAIDPRGFRCTGDSQIQCFGVTGEQVLTTLSEMFAPILDVKDHFFEDCWYILAVALFFKILFYVVGVLMCHDSKHIKRIECSGDVETSEHSIIGTSGHSFSRQCSLHTMGSLHTMSVIPDGDGEQIAETFHTDDHTVFVFPDGVGEEIASI